MSHLAYILSSALLCIVGHTLVSGHSDKQLGLDRSRLCCISVVCNKMAWNSKHPLESASRSLLENFEFFAYTCL